MAGCFGEYSPTSLHEKLISQLLLRYEIKGAPPGAPFFFSVAKKLPFGRQLEPVLVVVCGFDVLLYVCALLPRLPVQSAREIVTLFSGLGLLHARIGPSLWPGPILTFLRCGSGLVIRKEVAFAVCLACLWAG